MALAIFDLDNTLIAGDSDHLWGQFMVDKGIVDGESFKKANDQFYQDYVNGTLNIFTYLEFALAPLAQFSFAELADLHAEFASERIEDIILPRAQALVEEHRAQNHQLLVITATNRFVAEPIVAKFGIDSLLASEAERSATGYTGKTTGIPCFQEGKVKRLQQWLKQHPEADKYETRFFYSDSANDLPLLEQVSHPVAVDPDQRLTKMAQERGWPIISLR